MARLLKAIVNRDETGSLDGLIIVYRVNGDERTLFLSESDIDGLTAQQVRALAQTRADADPGAAGEPVELRTDIIPNPKAESRQWYIDNPATQALFDDPLVDVEDSIGALVDFLFPNATVGQKGQLRKLLTSFAANDRVLVHEQFGS